MYLRVNGVQYDVYHVGYEVDVGLASAAAALLAERCVVCKAPEEQLEVVHAQHVVRVANAGGLEQVAVVSGERVGEERLAHVRSPNGQYAVALRVAADELLQQSAQELSLSTNLEECERGKDE